MSAAASVPVVNRLIESLSRKDGHRVLLQCEIVDLEFGTVLCEAEQPIAHAYFPLTGFISLVKIVEEHQPLEIALIGNEGMLGATLALGVGTAPLRGIVHGTGTALRISAAQLHSALRDCPNFLSTINRYLYVVLEQLAQAAACTHFHEIEARLARWLLMTHDRAHADHFHLTHKFLADMLGVQRSAITIAAGGLQKRNLIHYTRGEINILDRSGLEAISCTCYKAVTDDYTRIFT